MAEKIEINENVFISIEDLNTFIEEHKIKKSNIISVENIRKEGLIDYIDNRQVSYNYRLLWIKETDGIING